MGEKGEVKLSEICSDWVRRGSRRAPKGVLEGKFVDLRSSSRSSE